MTRLEKQIIDTWLINHRTNLMLIEELTQEALDYTTSKRGGGTIGHQLAHMYNVRLWKLEKYDKKLVLDLKAITAKEPKTTSMLKDCHIISAERVAVALEAGLKDDAAIKGFKRGVVPLLGYFISHEAHHRGNILLTLKICGFKINDKLQYNIWDWNNI
ncbi:MULTISPECIES: DinB family protein [Chryseobacterium]|jgi:uncharacterized damage-inducible protein DinB|uniref:Damage-inducible protein DinB n=1 Tax=Chryseobacterium geocarposphaerae TaxID=1416776 RepID=A0ABU1LA71_9FLAO|nr:MULTISPECIES: DinB family protein [Chryseobacterium]ALR29652.1 hypothetical protein ATE47_03525 [Chryseobacterium sp. IHB B 17019]MDR6403613.1 putative damage-inducible protein DinB [Chryseobacterium geocarposphaerae]MDR6697167.1 putative damage-inducible protein DinB [Chryseobacterium ginsenosidimutans]